MSGIETNPLYEYSLEEIYGKYLPYRGNPEERVKSKLKSNLGALQAAAGEVWQDLDRKTQITILVSRLGKRVLAQSALLLSQGHPLTDAWTETDKREFFKTALLSEAENSREAMKGMSATTLDDRTKIRYLLQTVRKWETSARKVTSQVAPTPHAFRK